MESEEGRQDSMMSKRDKRVISPSSMGSGGDKIRKKRKASEEGVINGIKEEMTFNHGISTGKKSEGKKEFGVRSVTKPKEMARKAGVQGLGENQKGVSDAYIEYHDEVGSVNNGIFHFGSGREVKVDSGRCNANIEEVKEIGKMIGVSWSWAEEVDKGYGGVREKRWIRSIIKDERPDVIRLQETKCGMVDNIWVEDMWGDMGTGYSQLPANGNSGGIIVIWDTRVFWCKEAAGDERFIAVKGEWKGRNEDVFLVCIYGPHVSRHKTSFWDRLGGLMNRWNRAWCIFGDLNVVRRNEDRLNSQNDIMRVGEEIDGMGIKFSTSCIGELRDGRDIRFWVDRWVDNERLCDRVSRSIRGRVSRELKELLGVVQYVVVNSNCRDKWRWMLGEDGEFTVKELIRLVEEKILHVESGGQETLWNNLVPKKVNIFVWRALKGRLSVRVELDRRGIDLDSVLCPSCNNIVETCAHCLVTCDLAMSVWEKVFEGGERECLLH
ncbi:RNA-directed DNA polymerase, eukaryota [Tanacetum coccineum]